MLGKLLKYELRSTAKFLLPINFVLIILSIMASFSFQRFIGITETEGAVLYSSTSETWAAFFVIVYIAGIIVAGCATVFGLVSRYNKNFFTDEGYLTFTLPIKVSTLFLTKVVNTVIWYVVYAFVTVISVIIMFISEFSFSEIIQDLSEGITIVAQNAGTNPFHYCTVFIIMLFITAVGLILTLYACFSLGHTLGKHKFLGSVIFLIIGTIISRCLDTVINKLIPYYGNNENYYKIQWMYIYIAISLVECSIYYFISHYCLTKKLNLE